MSHRGTEWTEDFKTKQWKSRRYRWCIEQRSLFVNAISNLYTKRLPQNSYQESVRYTSVALCAIGTSVTLCYLRPLRDSVCLLYKTFSLSLHISEEPFLKLYQPYAIFLKINDWLYIKFEALNGGTFFPNVSYFIHKRIIR